MNADGLDDVWASNSSSAGGIGGVYLLLGREEGFGDDIVDMDDAADAAWLDDEGPEYTRPIGAGHLNGDEFADMLVFAYAGGNDTLWTLLPGGALPSGEQQINQAEGMHSDYEGNELLSYGHVFLDLDGDGIDEVGTDTRRTHDGDSVAMYLQGEDLQDGASLADVAADAWVDGTGEVTMRLPPSEVSESDDVDGDGLHDALVWTTTAVGADDSYCIGVFSGGVPAGEFSGLQVVSVCAPAGGYVKPQWGGWQDDVDGDGVRDVQVLTERGWTPLLSSQLREGGVQSGADFRGPVTYWGAYFTTTADFNGDGLPEWVYYEPEWDDPDRTDEAGRTLILTGFEIPWDDASKW